MISEVEGFMVSMAEGFVDSIAVHFVFNSTIESFQMPVPTNVSVTLVATRSYYNGHNLNCFTY